MQYVWFPTFVFESHVLYFDVEWTKTSRTCFWIKKAILPIRHIHNPTKFFFLCRPKMYYHCYTLVYCVVLLYQYTRWMYCYYKDKKFKPYNCFTAIFIREKLGKYGENQFKRYSIIAIIGPRMYMASIERLDINDHFCLVFFHMSFTNAVQCVSKRE